MKTARFAEIVERCGAPETYLLWVPPKQDKDFQRAVTASRIMTIHSQNVGAKKDSGTVGFIEEPNAQYLLFPKSLTRYADRRVVGINYALLAKGSRSSREAKTSHLPKSPKPKAPSPRRKEASQAEKKVVPFEDATQIRAAKGVVAEAKTERKTEAKESVSPQEPAMNAAVLRELKKAVAELRAGKAVPAYERLEALVKANVR